MKELPWADTLSLPKMGVGLFQVFPHLARLSILGMRLSILGMRLGILGKKLGILGMRLGILGMRSRLSNEVSPLPLWFSAKEVHLHRVVITWGRQVGGRGGPGGRGRGDGT